ncbi:SDR family NAD(P)-dependent oxidoreductase [Candidatus Halocynthiibacter alkanivorans]|uniref:SDR family NAD(P)-dependent oxidoreductase n=1 Tax=Candidatus Halocynthiibacter alkanivorans TaxID=2267619 RepID=UPI000DF470CF|nr:SDR family oxidoreductase [Candidatus Halocynthiibacter alkanivorans]
MTDVGSDLFSLAGKTACVTGASSGLGRHAATFLAQNGVKVVGVARRSDQLKAWQASASGNTHFVAADLSDQSALGEVAAEVGKAFGVPDILINAAGINTRQAADDVTLEGWNVSMDLNLAAPFFLAQSFSESMKSKNWGRIINFASLQSFRAFPGGIAYGASKAGIAQLTRAMAEAWSPYGITANAIAPGFFRTELTEAVFSDPERSARNAAQTCIGRNGEPSDLDGPLQFLCSDASAYVTGQVLAVDGGYTAK